MFFNFPSPFSSHFSLSLPLTSPLSSLHPGIAITIFFFFHCWPKKTLLCDIFEKVCPSGSLLSFLSLPSSSSLFKNCNSNCLTFYLEIMLGRYVLQTPHLSPFFTTFLSSPFLPFSFIMHPGIAIPIFFLFLCWPRKPDYVIFLNRCVFQIRFSPSLPSLPVP